ncbi:sensor histidine kinase [Solemya pervernicosa gill symbiont]|uniref:sensor histidine kinase n=1 Tax=Solemya pervernicosa gill symbiont TaxID=642797 RepID=UPI001082E74B|nr:HAMP domain-containing sensor histidine kinase [Solemya pervernicosa gill symbiont]
MLGLGRPKQASAKIATPRFHADLLGGILRSTQTPSHRLMLIYPSGEDLIEVTAEGPRINLDRHDYRLSAEERSRIMKRIPIPGTAWEAVDMHDPELFSSYRQQLLLQMAVILLLFSAVVMAMLYSLGRAEQRRRMAEQHKDDFLSNVSHELRTPLTSIRGSLGLVINGVAGEVSEKAKGLLDIALNNSERLSGIVNDILDLKKIESGQMELEQSRHDLVMLVRRAIESNHSYGERFGAEYVLLEAPDSVEVEVDGNRILQVMTNLLSNAAKYGARNDRVEIVISVKGERVRVSVTDHGEGIDEAFHERVFERFAREGDSSIERPDGTGLGLNISRVIIEAHRGEIDFDCAGRDGTTFYFELPVS